MYYDIPFGLYDARSTCCMFDYCSGWRVRIGWLKRRFRKTPPGPKEQFIPRCRFASAPSVAFPEAGYVRDYNLRSRAASCCHHSHTAAEVYQIRWTALRPNTFDPHIHKPLQHSHRALDHLHSRFGKKLGSATDRDGIPTDYLATAMHSSRTY